MVPRVIINCIIMIREDKISDLSSGFSFINSNIQFRIINITIDAPIPEMNPDITGSIIGSVNILSDIPNIYIGKNIRMFFCILSLLIYFPNKKEKDPAIAIAEYERE
uniref:Uncharacterized protein n=1 Tax=Bacillus cereus TaxID=1396 RepID=Q84IY3_BACCE|nr:hypothetical protein [Bacillus cereus]